MPRHGVERCCCCCCCCLRSANRRRATTTHRPGEGEEVESRKSPLRKARAEWTCDMHLACTAPRCSAPPMSISGAAPRDAGHNAQPWGTGYGVVRTAECGGMRRGPLVTRQQVGRGEGRDGVKRGGPQPELWGCHPEVGDPRGPRLTRRRPRLGLRRARVPTIQARRSTGSLQLPGCYTCYPVLYGHACGAGGGGRGIFG